MTLIELRRRAIRYLSRILLPDSHKKVVHAHINGYSLLVLANEDVGRAIYFMHNYERPETEYLRKIITPNAVCIDIGANVGYFAMLMAKTAAQGKVYAFDPIPLNSALLRASAELNGLKNIEIVESAVGAYDGEVPLVQSADSAYSSIRDTERKAVERVLSVPITTLDAFVHRRSIQSIDVLKIDVEGAEGLVLDGSQALLSDAARRPRVVLMEILERNLASYETSAAAIIDKMRFFSYTPYFVSNAATLSPFRADLLAKFENVLFLSIESKGNS